MGLVALPFGLFCGFGCFALFVSQLPQFGLLGELLLAVTFELLGAAFAFFALIVIWAIAAPSWVERLFRQVWKKLWIAVLLSLVPIALLLILALFGLRLGDGSSARPAADVVMN